MTKYNIYVEVSYTETYTVEAVNELEARDVYLNDDHGNGNPASTSEKDRKLLYIEQTPEDDQPKQLELYFGNATEQNAINKKGYARNGKILI